MGLQLNQLEPDLATSFKSVVSENLTLETLGCCAETRHFISFTLVVKVGSSSHALVGEISGLEQTAVIRINAEKITSYPKVNFYVRL